MSMCAWILIIKFGSIPLWTLQKVGYDIMVPAAKSKLLACF
jgi:hypothetical protein